MNNFIKGFEKAAGLGQMVSQGARALGKATGVSQFRAGMKQVIHSSNRGQVGAANMAKDTVQVKPGFVNRVKAADKNLKAGVTRMAGTAAVGGAGLYAGNKLLGSSDNNQG
jgi:hypothetical protein